MNEELKLPSDRTGRRKFSDKYAHLVGYVSGDLTIETILDDPKYTGAHCLCRCKCGNTRIVSVTHVSHGMVKSCGKCNYHSRRIREALGNDLTGKQFNFLKVLELSNFTSPNGIRKWKCSCVRCGRIVYVVADSLKSGNTKSCGQCGLQKEIAVETCVSRSKYSDEDRDIMTHFHSMKQRCYDTGCEKYHRYGGRGITICNE